MNGFPLSNRKCPLDCDGEHMLWRRQQSAACTFLPELAKQPVEQNQSQTYEKRLGRLQPGGLGEEAQVSLNHTQISLNSVSTDPNQTQISMIRPEISQNRT